MFRRHRIAEVSPHEAARQQKAGAVLLDVRDDDEWAAGHAPGAVHVPLRALPGEVGRLPGRAVLTVCRAGGRSARAARILAGAGLDAANVSGGMSSWAAAGLPVRRTDGSPGTVI